MRRCPLAPVLVLSLLAGLPALAQSPVLHLQGALRNQAGGPAPDGDYAMGLAIYGEESGGKALFEETWLAVPVVGGAFALEVGAKKAPLDPAIFGEDPRWIGLTVGANPEFPRVRVREVAASLWARTAKKALGLECSGCVATAALADGAVTGDKIAANAVSAKHVSFTYAGSDSKGGPATSALLANQAKAAETATAALSADKAKEADTAKYADQAKQATSATSADEAKTAGVAAKLQCTGCVGADMLAATVVADLVAKKALAAVAASGKYGDLVGAPGDVPSLVKDNVWKGNQDVQGTLKLGQGADFAGGQALVFRFQNAAKEPLPCSATTAGLAFFDTAKAALMLCNGKEWGTVGVSGSPGTVTNPGASCKALAAVGLKVDGVYWLRPGALGQPFEAWCDLTGGGWTLVMKLSDASAFRYDHKVWTQTDDAAAGLPKPSENVDAVSRAFYWLPATETRVCMNAHGTGKLVCETFSHAEATGRALANGPQPASSAGANNKLTDNWKSIVPGSVWGGWTWHRWGWNHLTTCYGSARLGFTCDGDSSDSIDSGIGLGVGDTSCGGSGMTVGSGYWQYSGWTPKPSPLSAGLQGYIWLR